jgi:hypothetical protein
MSSLKGLVGGAQKLAETFFGFRTFDLFRLVLELSAAGSSNGGSAEVRGNTKLKLK